MLSDSAMTMPISCSISTTVRPNSRRAAAMNSASSFFSVTVMPPWLVEQQEARFGGQRPGELDTFEHAIGQRAGQPVGIGVEMQEGDQLRARSRAASRSRRAAGRPAICDRNEVRLR